MDAYHESKLGKYMMIGGLLGAAVSLFHRGTRACMREDWEDLKGNTRNIYHTVRQNPGAVQGYLRETTDNWKMTAREVSDDVQEMADKIGGARQSSTDAYRYAMEAGSEMGQIASKIRNTRQGAMRLPSSAQNQAVVTESMPKYSQNNLTTQNQLPTTQSQTFDHQMENQSTAKSQLPAVTSAYKDL